MSEQKDEPKRMLIVFEADAGSSMFDVKIENADAAQLFAAAGILHANANLALAGQMSEQEARKRRGLRIPGVN